MHRSGTAALTRTLSLLGFDLPKTLMGVKYGNKLAHWESRVVMALNDEIFASLGSAWYDWRAFKPRWDASPNLEEFRQRAKTTLESEFGNSRMFVLKDPRFCRLLGLWAEAIEAFGALPLIVSPIRNPLEVAASLETRNGMDPSIAQLLWLRHVLDGELASRNMRRCYVRYDDLLEDWRAVVDKLGNDFGVAWPERSREVEREIEAFLSPVHRHHVNKDEDVFRNPDLSQWIKSSFEILSRWASGELRKSDTADLDGIRAAFDEAMQNRDFKVLEKIIEKVAKPTTPAPIAEAQKLARKWRAKRK